MGTLIDRITSSHYALLFGDIAGVDIADHLCTSRLEGLVQLLDPISEVVPVALLVANAKDRHGLPAEVSAFDVINDVIPCRARAVLVRVRVPRRASHNEAIELRQVLSGVVPNAH